MKAKELMIGDWVQSVDGSFQMNKSLFQCFDSMSQSRHYEPIPITEDILKLNNITDDQYEFYDGYNFEFHNRIKDCISVGALWYVHELQHALRLCRFNDLTNNFRIE